MAACAEIAHGINVKLAKSGGLREAVRMAHAARALGLGLMLGCMVESGLGIAPGAHIAALFDHVDLDGNILIREDPWPGIELVDGVQMPSVDRAGPGRVAAWMRHSRPASRGTTASTRTASGKERSGGCSRWSSSAPAATTPACSTRPSRR